MPRTTFKDRARKRRIRAREFNAMRRQLIKLDAISDAQIASLKQIVTHVEKHGSYPRAAEVADLEALRGMGVLRIEGEQAVLTAVGLDVLASEVEA